MESVNVDILWIPSHAGIVGNSIADLEAKKALNASIEMDDKVIWTDFIIKSKSIAKKNWQTLWNNETKGRTLYKLKPIVSSEPWFKNIICREEV